MILFQIHITGNTKITRSNSTINLQSDLPDNSPPPRVMNKLSTMDKFSRERPVHKYKY